MLGMSFGVIVLTEQTILYRYSFIPMQNPNVMFPRFRSAMIKSIQLQSSKRQKLLGILSLKVKHKFQSAAFPK